MKILSTSLLLLLGLSGFPMLRAAETPASALLVLAKADNTLAIVDPATLKVLAKLPIGNDPHEVVASTDGRIAYVSNYGFGAYNTLAVVDLVARKVLPSVELGALRGPHGLAFTGDKVWFTAESAKAIGRYDPTSKTIDWVLGTGQNRTHMIYVSPDMKTVVTTNVSSGTVSIIEKTAWPPEGMPPATPRRGPGPPPRAPGGEWNETVVPVGNGAEGFEVSPDSREVWAANAGDGTVSIIDLASKKVIQTLAADVPGANRLKFTPNGKLVLVSTLRGGNLTVIDAASRKVVKRVPLGRGAAGIVMQPDGSRAFVACSPDDYVAVIDLHTLEVVGKIEAGKSPDGLAWVERREH